MATVTGFTSARMLEIENTTVVDGEVDENDHLILKTREGTEIDAGYVKGEPGDDATVPDASTTVKGKIEIATPSEAIAGLAQLLAVTPEGLYAAIKALVTGRNKIINGKFRVNQRAAASGTSLGSGTYFLDRWKSTSATNSCTWTGDDIHGRTVTVPASKTIAQVIERGNLPAGEYVLSWTGTAQARVYNSGAGSPPSYASSPVLVTLNGAADVVVEFNAGTVSKVQLEPGDKPTPYEDILIGDELAKCQRYFYAIPIGNSVVFNPYRGVGLSGGENIGEKHPVTMRDSPAVNVLPTDPYPAALFFEYLSESAGGAISRVLVNSNSTIHRLKFLYSSGNNGGSLLTAGYNYGRSTKILWVNAEL